MVSKMCKNTYSSVATSMLFPRILTRRSKPVHMDCDFRLTGSAVRRALMGTCDELEKWRSLVLTTTKLSGLCKSVVGRHNQPILIGAGGIRGCWTADRRGCVLMGLSICATLGGTISYGDTAISPSTIPSCLQCRAIVAILQIRVYTTSPSKPPAIVCTRSLVRA